MRLPPDLKEFVELLNSEQVEYVIAGGWAFGFHARPRFTFDLDIFIRPTAENAARMVNVIRRFGFGSLGLAASDFLQTEQVVQLGQAPNRIDVLTSLTGVEQDEAWQTRQAGSLDGIPVFFLSRSTLIKNKRSTGRKRDQADLDELESDV
jgi:hypothetical protein